jgi:hypothetical protein
MRTPLVMGFTALCVLGACSSGDGLGESVAGISSDPAGESSTTVAVATNDVAATAGSTTTMGSRDDELGQADSCVSTLWKEISDEPATIRQFSDYEALRAAGIDVDEFGETFSPELRGVVLPAAVMMEITQGEPVSIPVESMSCYLGAPLGGSEFVRLTSTDPVSSLPAEARQEEDLVLLPGDRQSTGNAAEIAVFDELLARGAIAGTSSAPANPTVWVTGIGVAPAESGFALIVVWSPADRSAADAVALMEATITDSDHEDALDLSAAEVTHGQGLVVATIPIIDRQIGIWRELTALFDPLMFPRSEE